MSQNYRKNKNSYNFPMYYGTKSLKVFRPNSMRLVNAELELNRLYNRVKELEEQLNSNNS